MPAYGNMTVEELKAKMDQGERVRLIDVREQREYDVAHIEGAELMPLGQIMQWSLELPDKNEHIVLHCHHGGRSGRACQFLSQQGFTYLSNLEGGIDAWSTLIDPSVPRY